ncbi:MAG: hypothetical protein K8S55_15885 [Phycisphaerae bacterium]|nr:hypothetical protein [Phycisphaerae bacterium]
MLNNTIVRIIYVASCILFVITTVVLCAATWGKVISSHVPPQWNYLCFWAVASLCWVGILCYGQSSITVLKQSRGKIVLLFWAIHTITNICMVEFLPGIPVFPGTGWLGVFSLMIVIGVIIVAALLHGIVCDIQKRIFSIRTFSLCISMISEGIVMAWNWSLCDEFIRGI